MNGWKWAKHWKKNWQIKINNFSAGRCTISTRTEHEDDRFCGHRKMYNFRRYQHTCVYRKKRAVDDSFIFTCTPSSAAVFCSSSYTHAYRRRYEYSKRHVRNEADRLRTCRIINLSWLGLSLFRICCPALCSRTIMAANVSISVAINLFQGN